MERPAHLTAEQNLRLLGRFSLACADREIALPGVRSRALLAFLACNAGKPYPREKLAGLFWGGRFEVQARQSRSEEHTSELQSLMRISYAVFCLKKKKKNN